VTPAQLRRVRRRLETFAEAIFEPIRRKDQRRWGSTYLRGLLLDGKRKSIQPMAARLARGEPGQHVDPDAIEQALQQFVSQSPWDWTPVRQRLAQRMAAAIRPAAWVIDDTSFPKFGRHSVGVAPQYCGALGKVANCQVGVSVHAVTDTASVPLDWQLFLPESWTNDPQRCRTARIPDTVGHQPKWQLALGLVDEVTSWGLIPPVILADAGYGDTDEFRLGLEQRGLTYVVQLAPTPTAYPEDVTPEVPPYQGHGRPPVARYRAQPRTLEALAVQAGRLGRVGVAWREGTDGHLLHSQFVALRIRPASRLWRRAMLGPDGVLPVRWLLAEWPDDEPAPIKYWLANLPADTSLHELVALAKLRWRVEHDYRELKDALGLDHFEGRSWPGWHHHVTLVSVAHAFVTLERLDPKARASA
jgi:SRSO17 transposase